MSNAPSGSPRKDSQEATVQVGMLPVQGWTPTLPGTALHPHPRDPPGSRDPTQQPEHVTVPALPRGGRDPFPRLT